MSSLSEIMPSNQSQSTNREWLDLLANITNFGTWRSARGLRFKELLCHTTIIDMKRPLLTVKERKLGKKFRNGEAFWILTGRNDVSFMKHLAPQIAAVSNDGYIFDGAYGPMLIDQLRYLVDTLWEDPGSRQAVATLWRPNPRPSKDIPCTISIQLIVRDMKLHCIDTMRSSDVWLGWPYDVFNFSMLSLLIITLLKQRIGKYDNPNIDIFRQLDLGELHLTAGSSHYYDNNEEAILKIVEKCSVIEYAPLDQKEFIAPEELISFLHRQSLINEPHPSILFQKELY